MDEFWAAINAQLEALKTAKSADDVMSILSTQGRDADSGFFGGSGGDGSIAGVLHEAGWSVIWMRADYFWAMQSPDGGSSITYIEGDVYRGTQRPV